MTQPPRIREATAADVPGIEALMLTVFGVARPPGMWRWLFRETPGGPGRSLVAVSDGRVVAHAGTITRPLVDGPRALLAAQSVDAMTAPPWRRRGLQRRLWERLDALHARDGVGLVTGFSNEQSTRAARGRGRLLLEPFPLLARPLLPCGGALCGGTVAPPEDVGSLIHAAGVAGAPGGRSVGAAVDAASLGWRYGRPGGEYVAREVREGGRLVAWGAVGVVRRRCVRVALLMHRLAASPDVLARLDRALLRAARSLGCRVALGLAFPGTSEREHLRSLGFGSVPHRLSPEHLSFGIRPLEIAEYRLLAPESWRLSWADHDLG